MNAVPGIVQPAGLALGFVVHRPEASLLRRLEAANAASWPVYVFDNSPDLGDVRECCRPLERVRYTTCGRNVGLGVGIAAVTAQAYYDGHAALLFFDQDTGFDESTLAFVSSFHAARQDLAATHSAIVFNGTREGEPPATGPLVCADVELAISSGSLFLLENLRRIGWHNPAYFVDCVDYEFCLNSSNHGLRVAVCPYVTGFDHDTEQAAYDRAFLGVHLRLRRYPGSRVVGTLGASARLLARAVACGNWPFARAIARFLAGYVWWQSVARVLPPVRAAK